MHKLEITDDDLGLPEMAQSGSAGLGNGTPVEPSPASRMTFRHSAKFGQLCKALCSASLEFPEITKDAENPYFRSWYADLASLIKATRSPLAKHGLAIVQVPQNMPAGILLTTMLMHTSEEWLACDLEMPAKVGKPKKKNQASEYEEEEPEPSKALRPDAQALGSAITFARRYSYQAILNIAGEEDDDGNAAVGRTQRDYQSKSTEAGPWKINPVQVRALQSACKTGKKTAQQLLDYCGSIGRENEEDIERSELDAAIKWALSK